MTIEGMFMKKQLPEKSKNELPAKNRTAEDTDLVRKYKKSKENTPALFKLQNKNNNEVHISPVDSDTELIKAKMFRAFGTSSEELQNYFMNQIWQVFKECSSSTEGDKLVALCCMGVTILQELRPRDVIEGMLITQMIGVHNMAIETLRRAMIPNQTFEGTEANVHQSTKLLRTFTQQMDTLKNYRQKGQQRVTVEHVNVNNGGQAIVGSVTKGGEG